MILITKFPFEPIEYDMKNNIKKLTYFATVEKKEVKKEINSNRKNYKHREQMLPLKYDLLFCLQINFFCNKNCI
jgi:hypothetical protein